MNKKIEKKVTYAFIDASNIIYGARAEGWFISPPKITARDLKIIVGNEHIDFGSLRYFLEYKKDKKKRETLN